jgi:hypothetical protein
MSCWHRMRRWRPTKCLGRRSRHEQCNRLPIEAGTSVPGSGHRRPPNPLLELGDYLAGERLVKTIAVAKGFAGRAGRGVFHRGRAEAVPRRWRPRPLPISSRSPLPAVPYVRGRQPGKTHPPVRALRQLPLPGGAETARRQGGKASRLRPRAAGIGRGPTPAPDPPLCAARG